MDERARRKESSGEERALVQNPAAGKGGFGSSAEEARTAKQSLVIEKPSDIATAGLLVAEYEPE